MRLALELLAFIFVASVLPALLADWHDRHTLRKQALGTAKGIIAEMQHGPGATHANMGDAWFEPNESDPGEMEEYESGPLAPARGCIIGTLIGLSMWAVVGWGLYEWLK
jgi:hypothetical protein